jgi:Tfp pilus assembly protein PilN
MEARRWRVSPLTVLMVVWGGITLMLILLLIYRSTLTMHEDDQLFLDDAESHMQQEQAELLGRMNKIQPFVKILGFASGLLIVVIAGLWIWQGINQM